MVPRVRTRVALLIAGVLMGACADGPPRLAGDNEPKPLTTDRLRAITRACGLGTWPALVPFNRVVGTEFQRWALHAFPGHPLPENFQNLRTPGREQLTRLRPGGAVHHVRPDAVGPAVTVVWERLLSVPRPSMVPAPGSVFVEVKAVKGFLTPSYDDYQVAGLIEAAATSPAALMADPERPIPAIIFITTGDTLISPLVMSDATARRVAIWHAVVFELPGSATDRPHFGLGPVVPRNPEVYGEARPQPLPPGPTDVPFPLPRNPVRSLPGLDVGDPDPPEVD